jgi:hypothetical protein
MASEYDPAEFVDGDLRAQKQPYTPAAAQPARAPSREEVDSRVADAQQRLAELKRAQEELERERTALEETRRRQIEFQTGRQEMIHHLTRGLGLLEEAEFNARRDAEQMAKTLTDLRDALEKVETIHEETWNKDNFQVELTRALTILENARMEWNSSRLKFPILSGATVPEQAQSASEAHAAPALLASRKFGELCRVGLALTWPVTLAALLGAAALILLLLRR